jgi:hypothetical protein
LAGGGDDLASGSVRAGVSHSTLTRLPKLKKKIELIVKEQTVQERQGSNAPQEKKLPKKRAQPPNKFTEKRKKLN